MEDAAPNLRNPLNLIARALATPIRGAGDENQPAGPAARHLTATRPTPTESEYPMRALPVTSEVLQQMAFDSGRSIELGANTAYLTVGGTTWYTVLPKASA